MKNSEAHFISREKRDVEDAGMCLLSHQNLHVHQNYIISSSDNLPNKARKTTSYKPRSVMCGVFVNVY